MCKYFGATVKFMYPLSAVRSGSFIIIIIIIIFQWVNLSKLPAVLLQRWSSNALAVPPKTVYIYLFVAAVVCGLFLLILNEIGLHLILINFVSSHVLQALCDGGACVRHTTNVRECVNKIIKHRIQLMVVWLSWGKSSPARAHQLRFAFSTFYLPASICFDVAPKFDFRKWLTFHNEKWNNQPKINSILNAMLAVCLSLFLSQRAAHAPQRLLDANILLDAMRLKVKLI